MRRRFTGNHDYVVITSASNSEVMTAMYANGLCANSSFMLKSECENVSIASLFKNSASILSAVKNFEEFKYFTNVSSLNYYNNNNTYTLFKSNTSLTSVTVPSSVTSIGTSAFQGCTSLTSVTIPSSVTSIGDNAFFGCTSLKSAAVPSSVTSIGAGAFQGCKKLATLNIANLNATFGENMLYDTLVGYELYSIPTTTYVYCPITVSTPSIPATCTSIGSYAFSGNTLIKSLNIPSSVKSLKERAFKGCTALTSITIPDGVTSIGNFAFENCASLSSISIPRSVTIIGTYAFSNCTSATFTESDFANISDIGVGAFTNCTNTFGIVRNGIYITSAYGADAVAISNSETNIGANAFSGKNNKTITVSIAITSIDNSVFKGLNGCTVDLPSSVTSIGYEVFQGSYSLILRATTPPAVVYFGGYPTTLYVPSASLDTYKSTAPYSSMTVQAIT